MKKLFLLYLVVSSICISGCSSIKPFTGYVKPKENGLKFKCPDNGSLKYKKDIEGNVELTVDCKSEPFLTIGDLPDVKLD